MRISRLTLTNFRNYSSLDLALPEGLVVLHGDNAQGKSNLLEAIELLALARSHRATNDREMVHWAALQEDGYALLATQVQRKGDKVSLRMALQCTRRNEGGEQDPQERISVQKQIRVNGVPRLASALVGHLTIALFTPDDLQLVPGAPALRRRYLDVLLSQVDSRYLRSLQQYQRLLTQRNSLLRLIKQGQAHPEELEFWDTQLCQEGGLIFERRLQAIRPLAAFVQEAYASLTGAPEALEVSYHGTLPDMDVAQSEVLTQALRQRLKETRHREIALGMTLTGPHRDDLRLLADGIDLSLYASRGQARAVALALRLAEGRYLQEQRGEEQVVLLDDVLSELDPQRRRRVLEHVSRYQQVLITATDLSIFDPSILAQATCFRVAGGAVSPEVRQDRENVVP